MTEVDSGEAALGSLKDEARHLGMVELEQPIGHAQLVHDLHDRGVKRISPELPLKVPVLLLEQHRDPLAGQDEAEDGAGGSSPDDAAGRVLDITDGSASG
jgi:hypothetical protein